MLEPEIEISSCYPKMCQQQLGHRNQAFCLICSFVLIVMHQLSMGREPADGQVRPCTRTWTAWSRSAARALLALRSPLCALMAFRSGFFWPRFRFCTSTQTLRWDKR